MSEDLPQSVSSASVRRGCSWLRGEGADADVVVSSRVRLARNVEGWPFVHRCTGERRRALLGELRERLVSAGLCERMLWVDVHGLPTVERTLLVERHLMSKEHAKGDEARGLAVSIPDEQLSIMVNEEDHLRVQVMRSGLALSAAMDAADAADDRIEAVVDYAYSPRFGYCTTCPTNVGTGLRVSVMLHLVGLKLTGELEKVKRATRDMSLAVRGFYGEGSEAVGDFFQLSNQSTLGKPERVILHEFEKEIVPQVVEVERAARRTLLEKRRRTFEDQVFRALGLLRSARLLTPEEAQANLSLVRVGVLTGLIPELAEQSVTQSMVLVQPAHLQRFVGTGLDQQKRREVRADVVRERLGRC